MTDATSLARRAYDHFQAAENVEAAAVLERMFAATPADAMVRAKLVTAYLRAVVQIEPDDVAEAERLLLRAVEVDAIEGVSHQSYDKFLRRHGRSAEADQRLDETAAARAAAAALNERVFVARKAYDARDYAASVAQLDEVLRADPDHQAAGKLAPLAAYRAGLLDHPSLDALRRRIREPERFADALARVAREVGVTPQPDPGGLPDRSDWTDHQRYGWGRRIDAVIRDQVLGGPESLAAILHRGQSLGMPEHLQQGGAVILLLHVGSINFAIGQVVASGIPFNLVTSGELHGLALPGQVIDVQIGRSTALLARMAVALRRGTNVVVAADGPLGQQVDIFTHHGVEYPIAAGPLALAHRLKARTHLLIAGYAARSLISRFVEGPPATASLETLQGFWGGAIREEVARMTALGPENDIRQANRQDV